MDSARVSLTGDNDLLRQPPLDWLPSWAYNREIAELARDLNAHAGLEDNFSIHWRDKLVYSEIARPAVIWGFWSTAVNWTFFFVFAAYAWHSTQCSTEHGFLALYPSWLPCIGVPVIMLAMAIEWRCLRRNIIVQVQWTGRFTILGVPVSYIQWIVLMSVWSLQAHFDIVSQNLFTAMLVRTWGCSMVRSSSAAAASGIWKATIRESVVAQVPGFDSLATLALVTWSLIPLQLVWALSGVVPLSKASYAQTIKPRQNHQIYRTLLNRRTFHKDAIGVLAVVNRMVSVSFQAMYQTIARAKWWVERPGMNDIPQYAVMRYLDQLHPLARTAAMRLLFFSILENAMKLELQVSILALDRALMPRDHTKTDPKTLIPVVLSFLTAGLTILCAGFQWRKIRQAQVSVQKLIVLDSESHTPWSRTSRCLVGFGMVLAVYSLLVTHCVAKLVMAYVCKDSMWNIALRSSGCVDLSSL